jgi:hypothetical protein
LKAAEKKNMNPIVRNILAVIAGLIVGGIVNMSIILLGIRIIAMPEGVDVMNQESLKASAHLMETKHFITPFVAHAAGTLVGALIASLLGASARMLPALIVGGMFLLGGIIATFQIRPPLWFIPVDLVLAYIPMAWLGWKLSGREHRR